MRLNTRRKKKQTNPSSLSSVGTPLIPGEGITHNPLPCCFLPWGTILWWHKSSNSKKKKKTHPPLLFHSKITSKHADTPIIFLSPFPLAIFSFACLHTVCQGVKKRGQVWERMTFPCFFCFFLNLSTQDVKGTMKKNNIVAYYYLSLQTWTNLLLVLHTEKCWFHIYNSKHIQINKKVIIWGIKKNACQLFPLVLWPDSRLFTMCTETAKWG